MFEQAMFERAMFEQAMFDMFEQLQQELLVFTL